MARLWIILLVIWYRAITIAKTEATKEPANHVSFLSSKEHFSDPNKNNGYLHSKHNLDNHHQGIRMKRSINSHNDENTPSLENENAKNPDATENSHYPSKNTPDIILSNFEDKIIKDNSLENENSIADLQSNELMKEKLLDALMTKYLPTYNVDSYVDQCLYNVGKRKFSSWGGKRASLYDDYNYQHLFDCLNFLEQNAGQSSKDDLSFTDDELSKLLNYEQNFDNFNRNKLSFHSWGGKRGVDDQLAPKRLPFRAWGGKRDNSIEGLTPKRLPFKAWGGKRTPETPMYPVYSVMDDPRIDKIAMLSMIQNYPTNEKRVNRKKTKFHSWGGKRSIEDNDSNLSSNQNPINDDLINAISRRRLKFNSWGGKRNAMYDFIEDPEEKRTFHSWGGKRGSNIDSWNENTFSQENPLYEVYKKTFHSWGGK